MKSAIPNEERLWLSSEKPAFFLPDICSAVAEERLLNGNVEQAGLIARTSQLVTVYLGHWWSGPEACVCHGAQFATERTGGQERLTSWQGGVPGGKNCYKEVLLNIKYFSECLWTKLDAVGEAAAWIWVKCSTHCWRFVQTILSGNRLRLLAFVHHGFQVEFCVHLAIVFAGRCKAI